MLPPCIPKSAKILKESNSANRVVIKVNRSVAVGGSVVSDASWDIGVANVGCSFTDAAEYYANEGINLDSIPGQAHWQIAIVEEAIRAT